jgi:hypothetical protein
MSLLRVAEAAIKQAKIAATLTGFISVSFSNFAPAAMHRAGFAGHGMAGGRDGCQC